MFSIGFISAIYNNMWCIRCYPNGKTLKGDFLVQLQLCGLPKQANKLSVSWKIVCETVDVTAGWTTHFSLEQSCWGWGNDQLSFDDFKKCDDFEISIEIELDDEDNVRAMVQWERFADKQNAGGSGHKPPPRPDRAVKFEVDDEKQNGGPPPNPMQVAHRVWSEIIHSVTLHILSSESLYFIVFCFAAISGHFSMGNVLIKNE